MSQPALEPWIDSQYRRAAAGLLQSISPLGLIKHRPGFGQTIIARPGAVVASPVLAAYDPDPDYFFHWYRDSALVIDALRLLAQGGGIAPATAAAHFADFVSFSLSLQQLDGRALAAEPHWRAGVAPDFVRYLRSDTELRAVHGAAVAGETRVNPDGSLDISSWARPQHDGPALRALTLLRWRQDSTSVADARAAADALLRADLAYVLAYGAEPSFDIWEEELGSHYYTLRVAAAALEQGAAWLGVQGEAAQATACRTQAQRLLSALEDFWLADQGYYRSRRLASGAAIVKELDIAVILAALHAGPDTAALHSVRDARMHQTLARLEQQFRSDYAINHDRPHGWAPALGRYPGDVYYSGGAYYFSTLAAAEFCFRAAAAGASAPGPGSAGAAPAPAARAWIERGDAFLQTVRMYTPASGELSEQFDQRTGAQTSARQLAWSYAAFISSVHARRRCTAP